MVIFQTLDTVLQKQDKFYNFRISYQEIPKKQTNKETIDTHKNQKQNTKEPIKWDKRFNNACFTADSGSAVATDHLSNETKISNDDSVRKVLTKLNSQA